MPFFHIFFIFSFYSVIVADNSCAFEHPTKGVINLTSIGLRNGQPRFRDIPTSSSAYYTYSFNPCFSFTENFCQDAAICQVSNDRQISFTLAKQNASRWTMDSNGNAVLTYTSASKTVSVTMICSNTVQDVLEVLGEDYPNHYSMRLQSRCACWNRCGSPRPDTTTTTTTKPSPATTFPWITESACRYRDSRYGIIDLSSIGSVTGKPTFKDVPSTYPNNYVWSYNPCYTFSEQSCHNVAGCQIDRTRGISYTIGLQEYTHWINMNKNSTLLPSIVYSSPYYNRRLTVQLICDKSDSSHRLQVYGETMAGEYVMQLRSPCACWDGCKSSPRPSPFNWNVWMIIGSVVAAVFFLFLIMLTCLFCSKPKRRYPVLIINEKTPFLKGTI